MKTCSNSWSPILTFWAAARTISNFPPIKARNLVLTQHDAVHAHPLGAFVMPSVDRSASDEDVASLEHEALLVTQDHRGDAMGDDSIVKCNRTVERLHQLSGNGRE